MELTENTTIADLPENTTLVKVSQTDVKYFNEENDTVETVRLVGRLTVPQCRDYVKTLHPANVMINKETVNVEFPVNTVALLQLNQGEI